MNAKQSPRSPSGWSTRPPLAVFSQTAAGIIRARGTDVSARIPNPVCGHRSDAANAFEIFQFRTGVFRTGHFLSRQFRRDQMNLAGRLKQFNQPRQGGPGRVSRWDGRPIRNATTLQKNGRKAEMRGGGRRPVGAQAMSDSRSLSGRSAVNWRFTSLVGQDRRASGLIVTAFLSRPTPSIPMLRIYRRAVPEKASTTSGSCRSGSMETGESGSTPQNSSVVWQTSPFAMKPGFFRHRTQIAETIE